MEKKIVLTSIVLLSLNGCINDAGRSGQPLITDFTLGTATDDESEEEQEVQEEKITRPNGAVFVKRNYCACLQNRPHIINNCESFCSDKKDARPTLYGEVEVKNTIFQKAGLRNLRGWCTAAIGDLTAPRCQLRLTDGEDVHFFNMETFENSNKFTVIFNSTALQFNVPYLATIVAEDTGSMAYSDSFQIYRIRPKEDYNQGPLKVMPISQYNCMQRPGGTDPLGRWNAVDILRDYFYFPANDAPDPRAVGVSEYPCHDIQSLGRLDLPSHPRLNLISHHFTLWDRNDSRFYYRPDGTGNPLRVNNCTQQKNIVINLQLQERLLSEYDQERTVNLFRPSFCLPTGPSPTVDDVTSAPPNNIGLPWGFTMSVFADQDGLSFCPTREHYNNHHDPLIRLLKEYISVDTEGLYLAWRASKSLRILNEDNQPDIQHIDSCLGTPLLIRESLLKIIWFYYKDGRHYKPNQISAAQETMLFYWPADIIHPYIKKSDQEIFIVKQSCQQNSNSATDGKLACIPSSGLID